MISVINGVLTNELCLVLKCYLQTILLEIIGLMSRVFAKGPRGRGLIPGHVIPKTQKWYLMPPCLTLSTIR